MLDLRAGPVRVSVDPDSGGRVSSIEIAGLELLVGRARGESDPLTWGMYPMAPWAGRVRNGRFTFDGTEHRLAPNLAPHAIHGTTFGRAWEVWVATDDSCEMSVGLGQAWPFQGRVTQRIAVDPGGLHLELQLEAEERMPASVGWHPWFVRDVPGGGALEVEVEAGGRWERAEDGIPSGRLVTPGARPDYGWDDCFTDLRSRPVLRWPGALEITLTSTCEHWVVFDATSHAVCVEPQTGPPDALNIGPSVVEPGKPLVATFDWSWRLG